MGCLPGAWNTRKRMKNCTPQSGVWNCARRVKRAGRARDGVAGAKAERVWRAMSVGVGAECGVGIGSAEEKPSICQSTMESSWQARERIRSPWKATLEEMGG